MTRLRAAALAIMTLGAVLVHAYAAAADFTIIQKNRAFSVRQIVIKVGDRVTLRPSRSFRRIGRFPSARS